MKKSKVIISEKRNNIGTNLLPFAINRDEMAGLKGGNVYCERYRQCTSVGKRSTCRDTYHVSCVQYLLCETKYKWYPNSHEVI